MATLMMCPELFPDCDVDNLGIDLSFVGCAVGNVETSCSAFYGFDVRYEVVGTGGMIVVGSYLHMPFVIWRNRTGAITGMISKWDRFLPAYFVRWSTSSTVYSRGARPWSRCRKFTRPAASASRRPSRISASARSSCWRCIDALHVRKSACAPDDFWRRSAHRNHAAERRLGAHLVSVARCRCRVDVVVRQR